MQMNFKNLATRQNLLIIYMAVMYYVLMYSSDKSNSSVEKTSRLAAVRIKLLPVDEELRGATLSKAIEDDLKAEKLPFACIAKFGTNGTCAFDNLNEIMDNIILKPIHRHRITEIGKYHWDTFFVH